MSPIQQVPGGQAAQAAQPAGAAAPPQPGHFAQPAGPPTVHGPTGQSSPASMPAASSTHPSPDSVWAGDPWSGTRLGGYQPVPAMFPMPGNPWGTWRPLMPPSSNLVLPSTSNQQPLNPGNISPEMMQAAMMAVRQEMEQQQRQSSGLESFRNCSLLLGSGNICKNNSTKKLLYDVQYSVRNIPKQE